MDSILTTKRLALRPFRPGDATALQICAGSWKIASMVGRVPHPYRDGLAEAFIAESARLRASGDAHRFAIDVTGRLAGCIGLDRTAPEEPDTYELGYWIGEPYWNRGIATEAAHRLLRFAFENLKAERVTAGHFVHNLASRRVLEKCGFRPDGESLCWCEARGHHLPAARYSLCGTAALEQEAMEA